MTLRIVLMSDIHGNLPALRAVVDSLPELDSVVVAGDLCLDGPNPGEVLDLLDELGWFLLMGNTDQDIVAPPEDLKDQKAKQVEWTRRQIGPSRLRRLTSLDFSARFSPATGAVPILGPAVDSSTPPWMPAVRSGTLWVSPRERDSSAAAVGAAGYPLGVGGPLQPDQSQATAEDTLLVVHANPRNLEDHLRPTMSEVELRPYLAGIDANVLAFGHLHTPYVRPVDDVLLVDVASVGHPKDHDLRASYTVMTWDNESRSISQIRIPYDVEETVHRMRHSSMPDAEKQVASLLKASY
jgi:predicted phosphodiesterase